MGVRLLTLTVRGMGATAFLRVEGLDVRYLGVRALTDVSLAVGLGKEVGVPMRLANLALEELTEALNRGWSQRDSRVGMLLQVERSKITPPAVDLQKVNAILANDN